MKIRVRIRVSVGAKFRVRIRVRARVRVYSVHQTINSVPSSAIHFVRVLVLFFFITVKITENFRVENI